MAGAATGHASDGDFDRVLVVDFGAQYAQLIARRVREAHVFSEIVPRDITAEEVARFLSDRIAAYKIPSRIEFRDALPKSAAGKVLRHQL